MDTPYVLDPARHRRGAVVPDADLQRHIAADLQRPDAGVVQVVQRRYEDMREDVVSGKALLRAMTQLYEAAQAQYAADGRPAVTPEYLSRLRAMLKQKDASLHAFADRRAYLSHFLALTDPRLTDAGMRTLLKVQFLADTLPEDEALMRIGRLRHTRGWQEVARLPYRPLSLEMPDGSVVTTDNVVAEADAFEHAVAGMGAGAGAGTARGDGAMDVQSMLQLLATPEGQARVEAAAAQSGAYLAEWRAMQATMQQTQASVGSA